LTFVLQPLLASSDEKLKDEAAVLLKSGKAAEGYEKLKEYVRTEGKIDYSDYSLLAGIGLGLKKFDEARYFANKALEVKPGDAPSLYVLGILSQADGKNDEAIKFYNRVLTDGDKTDRSYGSMYIRALLQLGVCYTGKGNLEEANSYYKQVLAIEPWHELANVYYGTNLIREERWKEALSPLSKAYNKNHERIEALGMFAMALAQTDQFSPAVVNYKELIQREPNNPNHYLNIARCLMMLSRLREAEKMMDKGLELAAKEGMTTELINYLGFAFRIYIEMGREDDAVKAFKDLKALNSEKADEYYSDIIKQWPHLEEKLNQKESLAPVQGPIFAKEGDQSSEKL